METGKIYKISNNFDEKEYIGQTWRDLEKRFKKHCRSDSGCLKLKNSIQSHGKENFKIELLWEGECTQEELDEYEIELIGLFNTLSPNGYNLTDGGHSGGKLSMETRERIRNSAIGRKATEETRAKMSVSRKGRKVSDETRAKLIAVNLGRVHTEETRAKMKGHVVTEETREKLRGRIVSEETRAKMSVYAKGRKATEETRAKISDSLKGRIVSEETRAKLRGRIVTEETRKKFQKPVEQWSLDGKTFINKYESVKLAAASTGAHTSNISSALKGHLKTSRGFVWRQVKEKESDLINDEL